MVHPEVVLKSYLERKIPHFYEFKHQCCRLLAFSIPAIIRYYAQIWHSNMPHNKIADRKGHQGWMKAEGPYFIFPGGGTMFPDGAIQYIEKLKQYIPIAGGVLRTALDMGCGV